VCSTSASPTGVFGSELTVPYYAFLDAGMVVDLASPRGGVIPVEPLSMKELIRTPDDDRMLGDERFRQQLMQSLAIADIDFKAYDIIYFAGGWGAAFDLGQSEQLGHKVSEAFAAGRVIGGICHGPLGLLKARKPNGEPLVLNRRITAVTDKQIHELGVEITPLHPETALRAAGAAFECRHHPARDFFANYYLADGDLITGQNQNAGPMVARLMMQRGSRQGGRGRAGGVMKLTDFTRKPNVLILVTDQEREVMHWPEGWAEANLPARRRLMAHGLHFTRAQCNTAACSSSRATFLTGLYPAQHGVKNLVNSTRPDDFGQRRAGFLSSRLPNLATVMAEAGYHVVLKGKLHVTRPVAWNPVMKRHYWSTADTAHLAERYGFHGWNPPDMSDPQSLSDLGGGATQQRRPVRRRQRHRRRAPGAAGPPVPRERGPLPEHL
jgi:putative intracellular protease/amidase